MRTHRRAVCTARESQNSRGTHTHTERAPSSLVLVALHDRGQPGAREPARAGWRVLDC